MSATNSDNPFHPKERWNADEVINEARRAETCSDAVYELASSLRQMAWSHNQLISDLESEDLPISNDD